MKFVYVMDKASKEELLNKGFLLLKEDERNSIWVFENKEPYAFTLDVAASYVLSDVLTF